MVFHDLIIFHFHLSDNPGNLGRDRHDKSVYTCLKSRRRHLICPYVPGYQEADSENDIGPGTHRIPFMFLLSPPLSCLFRPASVSLSLPYHLIHPPGYFHGINFGFSGCSTSTASMMVSRICALLHHFAGFLRNQGTVGPSLPASA